MTPIALLARLVASDDDLAPAVTDEARRMDGVWDVYLWLSVAVFALVALLTVYVVLRFRRRDDRLPRQKHYNIPMELLYTVVPLLVIVALFVVTVVSLDDIAAGDDDPDVDLVVHVTAFQWQWRFDYPDAGVTVVGGAADDVPELVLPAGATVRFELESLDVVHSFWVTAFRFKRDIIPGEPTNFTVSIADDAAGAYPDAGVCAEYCGLDHARMRFDLRVLEPGDFDAWLADQPAGRATTDGATT